MATTERDIYTTTVDEDVQPTTNQCPECDGRVTTNAAESVCDDCGLVLDDQRIDHGPEWHSFDAEKRERTGAPLTAARHDRGLSTEIGHSVDANGNTLSGRKRRQLSRLRREHKRSQRQSTAEQNLAHGLGEVRRIVSALGLPESLRDQACQLFRSAQSEDLLVGRSIEAMAAASVYGACRCNGISRTLDGVSEPARVEQASVTNAYKTLNRDLGLPAQPVVPSDHIVRIASAVEACDQIRQRARKLAEQAEAEQRTAGVNPSGFAAACLYVAGRERGRRVTQVAIAEVASVTPATIRKHSETLTEL
ncbi:transcription initiation factor IIB [Candidatus Halobonum tyrrellensis]|uniref:Transcription initiation factor IIB n=1 Tax=Candidatus Halobonum tyrrellensis G22 TaxID=1324957 RepID=V4H841_9EURY|nr:transcription initiation factor IIB family protein [Candidatus Halobonum tyrrellensis]ESP86840.1 transcription initiation factor TFB [Candidatus Halobonum tyrrellensis G22]